MPQEHDFPITRMPHPVFGGAPNFPVFRAKYYVAADDLTMGVGSKYTPLEYHEAIKKLDKWFLRRLPDGISKIAKLVPNAKGQQCVQADIVPRVGPGGRWSLPPGPPRCTMRLNLGARPQRKLHGCC